MSSAPRRSPYTAAEYLALDDAAASQRYQYDAGYAWALPGGTRRSSSAWPTPPDVP